MNDNKKASVWLQQATDDYAWGVDSLKSKHYSQTCFISQQIAEKSLKSLAFYRGYDLVKTHSIRKIAQDLKINGDILKASKRLDLYYISSRYPDGLPDLNTPSSFFDKDDATEALALAKTILDMVTKEVK